MPASEIADLPLTDLCPDDQWKARRTANGILCWDTDPAARDGAELLESLIDGTTNPDTLPMLSDNGAYATVRSVGELAVKIFGKRRSSYNTTISGLVYLQTSAALHHGLIALQEVVPDPVYKNIRFAYRAPRPYASFIPRTRGIYPPPIMVMSKEEGVESQLWQLPKPTHRMRQRMCRNAMGMAGLPPRDLVLDKNPKNVLLQQIDKQTVQLTQLDVLSRARRLR